jgi:hypothetical protein
MIKDKTPPPKPKGSNTDLDNIMSQANANIKLYEEMLDEKFLSAIPAANRSNFLATICSDDFLKTFATYLGKSSNIQVKFEKETTKMSNDDANADDDQQAYTAFVAAQNKSQKRSMTISRADMLPQIALEMPRFLYWPSHLASN